MSILTGTHSSKGIVGVVDGLPIVGLWDGDDAIKVSPSTDEGEFLIGADGSGLWSQMSDESAVVTLQLQPTSPTHKQLLGLRMRQQSGSPSSFSFSLANTSTLEAGTGAQCFISRKADTSQGQKAAVREWTIAVFRWVEV